jgi:Putative zinc-binding metallo-peptidase
VNDEWNALRPRAARRSDRLGPVGQFADDDHGDHGRVSRRGRQPVAGRACRWETLDDAGLLKVRFRDLGLRLEDSLIGPEVDRLHAELDRRGLRFRPHVWFSTDWFSPDGVPGIAVPYFAGKARLRRLERRMTGEVDGGNRAERLRILRHECGHAMDTAYGLRRRADWRRVFGPASQPYSSRYTVRPRSRAYVLHLDNWYAQSHPTEDFAETFAVWLQPKARWRREYADWPALEKLRYVDALMEELGARRPRKRDRSVIAPLSQNSRTLGEHYRRKTDTGTAFGRRYDDWLRRTFAARAERPKGVRAAAFLRASERRLRRMLLRRTEADAYLVAHVMGALRRRVRELDLVLGGPRREYNALVARLHEEVVADMLERNHERYVL